jgi:hypothetical protein
MALIQPVYTRIGEHTLQATWTFTENDTCVPVQSRMADYADRLITFGGAFGGATAKVQGSNDDLEYFDLRDNTHTVISKTAFGGEQILETPAYIKPVATGGTAQTLKVILNMRRGRGGEQ